MAKHAIAAATRPRPTAPSVMASPAPVLGSVPPFEAGVVDGGLSMSGVALLDVGVALCVTLAVAEGVAVADGDSLSVSEVVGDGLADVDELGDSESSGSVGVGDADVELGEADGHGVLDGCPDSDSDSDGDADGDDDSSSQFLPSSPPSSP